MKRLLWYLNQITDSNTTTFRYTAMVDGKPVQKEIYDGECTVTYLKPNGDVDGEREGIRREPTYWQDGISYTFERTNRLAVDRPTITIAIPVQRLGIKTFTPAAADFCLREIAPYFEKINAEYANKARPDKDNGKFYVYAPGGEVLVRNASYFAMRPAKDYKDGPGAKIFVTRYVDPPPDQMCLCLRIEVQLPHGKLKRMKKILVGHLPDETQRFVREFDKKGLHSALALEKTQHEIRKFLKEGDYCAFIANGSILAREKGTTLPMKGALPFKSTAEDEIEIAGVKGLGIRRGVTVITGGGYSGKSTLLNAVSAGIYNHVAGDGRELCITDSSAVTITAEDGRAVSCLNISPFIKWIQGPISDRNEGGHDAPDETRPAGPGKDTRQFSTSHASGSTSQAANIMEAVGWGAKLLLIDEDRSATNFMIRDALMKELIKKEPITPFTDRVRELAGRGISTILVIGGSGEYLSVAGKIYMMDDFVISDVTLKAKELAFAASASLKKMSLDPASLDSAPLDSTPLNPASLDSSFLNSVPLDKADWTTNRVLLSSNFSSYPEGSGTEKLEVSDTGFIIIGDERIDIRTLHDIATPAQVDAIGFMLRFLMRGTDSGSELEALAFAMRGISRKTAGQPIDVAKCIEELYKQIKQDGLDLVDTGFFTAMGRFLDLPREFELYAAINRMRRVTWAGVK